VELGLDKISNGGKHLALVSASYSSNDQVQGTLGILGPMRMHYERVITAVAFMAQIFLGKPGRRLKLWHRIKTKKIQNPS
jgi:transcriptional regulator of heat shock response